MRKIVANFFISLDGVVESPDRWHFPYFDDQMGALIGQGMASSDAMLMGRTTYEEWASYWPTSSDEPFASQLNSVRKHVVSSTLTSVSWSNSSLVEGDVAESLRALKAEPGKDIAMSGSGTLVNWLMRNGLLDELNLLVHPIVVGSGTRLFDDARPPVRLELVSADTFGTGVQHLRYHPLPPDAEEDVVFGG